MTVFVRKLPDLVRKLATFRKSYVVEISDHFDHHRLGQFDFDFHFFDHQSFLGYQRKRGVCQGHNIDRIQCRNV